MTTRKYFAPSRKSGFTASTSSKKPRKPYKQPERALHSHVFNMLLWIKPDCVWFPVPNGLDVGAKLGGILKAQGKIKSGVSDFFFGWRAGAGAIELKYGDGRQSEDQEKFEAWCKREGVPYRIARSIDEVVAILVEWGRLPANAIERIRGVTFPADKKIAAPEGTA